MRAEQTQPNRLEARKKEVIDRLIQIEKDYRNTSRTKQVMRKTFVLLVKNLVPIPCYIVLNNKGKPRTLFSKLRIVAGPTHAKLALKEHKI